jgi:hypothetical protein
MASITLRLAGITVRLDCDQEVLAERLRRRYLGFEGGGKEAMRLEAQVTRGGKPGACLGAEMRFTPDGVTLQAADFAGEISLTEGRGSLRLGLQGAEEGVEYFLRVAAALLAFEAGGLLFHGAGIVRSGWAFVFFGASGSGKTTVARLSPRDEILNDDLLVLLPAEAGWQAHATPFWNPTQEHPRAQHAPLAGLFRLAQDCQVFLEPLSRGQALAEVVASAPVIAADAGRSAALMQRAAALIQAAPLYRLHFLPDASFWPLVEAAGRGRN